MAKRVMIDPVTRIEGHAKISIFLDDAGKVDKAQFHVAEFRGFEKFCEGRPFTEMAGITARVCGICPVSHLMASVKAGDEIMSVRIPPAAEKLRRLMNMGQIIQSHALSFFHLSSPDLLLGYDSDPKTRNVFGLAKVNPDLARGGIRLRQFGQQIIEALGGQRIHPAWVAPGGVRGPLTKEWKETFTQWLPEVLGTTRTAIGIVKTLFDKYPDEVATCGNFDSLLMGLVADDGTWEHYGGKIRFIDTKGQIVADKLDPLKYYEYIGECPEDFSYLKSPYYLPMGYPDGIYRVGPLARVNLADRMGTPEADNEQKEFKSRRPDSLTSSFYFHYARLIEVLCSLERIGELLKDADILSDHHRARASVNQNEGVGVSEAPRGTLFHHYHVDDDGLIQKVNLLIATGQNNLAMNRAVTQIAKHFIKSPDIPEGVMNRIEAGVRAFDPCLSCSTHAVGQMPLVVEMLDTAGNVVAQRKRS